MSAPVEVYFIFLPFVEKAPQAPRDIVGSCNAGKGRGPTCLSLNLKCGSLGVKSPKLSLNFFGPFYVYMDGIFDQSEQIWTKSHDKVLKTLLVPFPKVISVPNYQEQTFFLIDQHCHHWKESNRLELLKMGVRRPFCSQVKVPVRWSSFPTPVLTLTLSKVIFSLAVVHSSLGMNFNIVSWKNVWLTQSLWFLIDFDWLQSIQ